MNDSEREALKAEIRDEMARRYGPALALVERLTRFRRQVEADGVDLPRRRNVFLGTTMKLLGNARIEDADGSYWDKTGIVLKATGASSDSIVITRDTYTPKVTMAAQIDSEVAVFDVYADTVDEGHANINLTGSTFSDSGNAIRLTVYDQAQNEAVHFRIQGDDSFRIRVNGTTIIDYASGYLSMPNLPSSNPGGTGRLWNNGGAVNIT